jgi:hypothetical protein
MKYCIHFTARPYLNRGIFLLWSAALRLPGLRRPRGGRVSETGNVAAARNHIPDATAMEFRGRFKHLPANGRLPVRFNRIPASCAFALALLLCLGGANGRAQQDGQPEMRGLDEQVQEIKSDVLGIAAELNQLEEKLLYPSGTQVAIFVALAKGEQMRLDAVRLEIDGQPVAHYIYSAKELEALRKGGVQRIYVGNVATGDHRLEVHAEGKLEGGADFGPTGNFTFRKEVKPKLVELTLSGPRSGSDPITLGEW